MRHAVATCLLAFMTLTHADAASVKIVALGASNTYGMGRGSHGASPAAGDECGRRTMIVARGKPATSVATQPKHKSPTLSDERVFPTYNGRLAVPVSSLV